MNKVIQAFLAATLFAGVASAQVGGGPPGPPPPDAPHEHGAFGPGPGRGFGPGMRPGKVVTGAPYQATGTRNFTQTLAGGNTIQRSTTATVARDSSGRTYEQETISGGPLASNNGPTTITFITDPVAGYTYVLNATTKVATRRQFHTPPAGSTPPARQRPSNPNVVETDLGTSTVNGVTAQGKRITHTIPAGQIGNAQAIVSTDEIWYSPDLQVVVSSNRNDPRMGTSVYALTNIQRTEPPAALFQVPSDYSIQDAKRPWGGGGTHPPQ
jgi:hypothetical protein